MADETRNRITSARMIARSIQYPIASYRFQKPERPPAASFCRGLTGPIRIGIFDHRRDRDRHLEKVQARHQHGTLLFDIEKRRKGLPHWVWCQQYPRVAHRHCSVFEHS